MAAAAGGAGAGAGAGAAGAEVSTADGPPTLAESKFIRAYHQLHYLAGLILQRKDILTEKKCRIDRIICKLLCELLNVGVVPTSALRAACSPDSFFADSVFEVDEMCRDFKFAVKNFFEIYPDTYIGNKHFDTTCGRKLSAFSCEDLPLVLLKEDLDILGAAWGEYYINLVDKKIVDGVDTLKSLEKFASAIAGSPNIIGLSGQLFLLLFSDSSSADESDNFSAFRKKLNMAIEEIHGLFLENDADFMRALKNKDFSELMRSTYSLLLLLAATLKVDFEPCPPLERIFYLRVGTFCFDGKSLMQAFIRKQVHRREAPVADGSTATAGAFFDPLFQALDSFAAMFHR